MKKNNSDFILNEKEFTFNTLLEWSVSNVFVTHHLEVVMEMVSFVIPKRNNTYPKEEKEP